MPAPVWTDGNSALPYLHFSSFDAKRRDKRAKSTASPAARRTIDLPETMAGYSNAIHFTIALI